MSQVRALPGALFVGISPDLGKFSRAGAGGIFTAHILKYEGIDIRLGGGPPAQDQQFDIFTAFGPSGGCVTV